MTMPTPDLASVTVEPKRVTAVVKLPMRREMNSSCEREIQEYFTEPTPDDRRMTILRS